MMDHLAILKKSWRLGEKILSGEKTIESRWYKQRRAPWNKIKKGDTVYFKNSGEPVIIKASVSKVLQLELNPSRVKSTLNQHYKDLGISKQNIPKFTDRFRDKKYCILIFLKNPKKIKPFNIDKKGYGMMAAWISLPDIKQIKSIR
ncbi:hypothetical protein ACFL0V_03175 [Nanoarchaeota archaeon]